MYFGYNKIGTVTNNAVMRLWPLSIQFVASFHEYLITQKPIAVIQTDSIKI